MKVLVVSGFLGAGKTTFIQELARRTGRDFVVYENEYGQADIDAARLAAGSDEGLSVWESTENCICCTGKQDFASSVLTIANSLDPEYLVVEPTGVARLSAVLENVRMVSYERIGLLAPVAIVDAGAWQRQRELAPDIYLDQVCTAAVVVVSKVGSCLPAELDELLGWIVEQNPNASVVAAPYGQLDDAWFAGLLAGDGHEGPGEEGSSPMRGPRRVGGREEDFETLSLAGAQCPTENHLIWFLDALVAGVFGQVARAKGTIATGGQRLRFDVVDRVWSLTGADPAEGSGLERAAKAEAGPAASASDDAAEPAVVFIGRDLKRTWLRETLLPAVRAAAQARTEREAGWQRYRLQKITEAPR